MAEKPLRGINFPGLPGTYMVPEIDKSLSKEGAAADAAAVGQALEGKVPVGLFTREIRVDSSANTGSAWDQLKSLFNEMDMGTVEYARVAIAVKYTEEDYLPGGGYMAQLVKIGGSDKEHPYGFIRLTNYWTDGFGLPQEYTCRCEGGVWQEVTSLAGVLRGIIEAQATYTAMMTNSLEV